MYLTRAELSKIMAWLPYQLISNRTSFQTLKKAAFGYSKEGILKYFNNDPVDYQKEFMILHHRASFPASNGKMITAEIEAAALLRLKAAGTLSGAGFNGVFSPQENDFDFFILK